MVFFTDEFRWENQAGALVRLGEQTTTIYYWAIGRQRGSQRLGTPHLTDVTSSRS